MAGKKKKVSKKKVEVESAPEPKAEPTPPPAIVEEATITVRGTSVGGTQKMTQTEYDKYCNAKK